jgi:hypothetical protein
MKPEIESVRSAIWRRVRGMLVILLVLLAATAVVCWLVGWRSLHQYGDGLEIAGVAAILLGGLSLSGGRQMAANPTVQYVQSVSNAPLNERSRQNLGDFMDSFMSLARLGVAGLLAAGLGLAITGLFP